MRQAPGISRRGTATVCFRPGCFRRESSGCFRREALRCSRRGSSSVFLCIILSALVSICFAFIYSTIEYTTASRADAMMRLSGDSLLSEFDRDVFDAYGLFLLRGSDRELSAKLRGYLMYTFGQQQHVCVSDVKASGASFPVADPQTAREQILTCMKAGGLLKLRRSDDDDGDEPRISASDAGRALRHGPTITSLPSRQLPQQDLLTRIQSAAESLFGAGSTDHLPGSSGSTGDSLASGGSTIAQIFRDGTDRYLLSSYALGLFNHTTHTADPDHFFFREVEYILQGELTDGENCRKTASALRMLRLPSNFAHICQDPAKQETLAAAAEIITPGPAAVLTQTALATAWAYAESHNDATLLMHGRRVPLAKDDASWAIDLKSVVDDTLSGEPDGVIYPAQDKGLSYEQYLRILLFLEDEDILTARILDLIQINMRKNVDGHFLIGECCSGVALKSDINRRDYDYEKIYQRILYR